MILSIALTVLGIVLLFAGYILGRIEERKIQDAANSIPNYGRVEKWEIEYIPLWRGWDAVGTYKDKDDGREMSVRLFLPNKLMREFED